MGEELVGFVCCDLGGLVRGRFVPASDLSERLDAGVGWVPANQAVTPFDVVPAQNPFGSVGDVSLRPDPTTEVRVPLRQDVTALHFFLADVIEPDGTPSDCCPRSFLKQVLERVENELGATVVGAFEHEFQLLEPSGKAPELYPLASFSTLEAQRLAEPFAGLVVEALRRAGVEPESFLPEYGSLQFEAPCAVAEGLGIADRSVVLKEVIREVARREGLRATFSPVTGIGDSGNGAHLHLSFRSAAGKALLSDPEGAGGLSDFGASFAAGILEHTPALMAIVAPSAVSYGRLEVGHWAAGVPALGPNRETLLRICGMAAANADLSSGLNLELRAIDACSNPYLALAATLLAGLDGVRRGLSAPPLLDRDPAYLSAEELAEYVRGELPRSLPAALAAFEHSALSGWLPPRMKETFLCLKRAELEAVELLSDDERQERYRRVF
jgi:glutamine synthetase